MEYTENTAVGCVIMASGRAVYAARQEELEDADTVEELERLRKLL